LNFLQRQGLVTRKLRKKLTNGSKNRLTPQHIVV